MLSVFLTAAGQMLKLLIFIGLGYLMARQGFLSDEVVKGIMGMVLRYFIPVMVFNTLQTDPSPELLQQGLIVCLLYALSSVAAWLLARLCLRMGLRLPEKAEADWQFDAIFSNAGFVGLPIITALFGSQEALFYGCCVIVTLNVFFGSIGEELYRVFSGRERAGLSLRALVKSPVLLAMALGLVCLFLHIRVPALLADCFSSISSLTGPLIMFTLGALMTKGRLRETFRHPSYYLLFSIRMVLVPLAFWALGHAFTGNGLTLTVIMVMCAMPGPAAAAPLALQYGDPVWASRYVVVSTLLSVLSLPLLYALAALW